MRKPLTQEIIEELPYLRRYARAIAGDQVGGDAAVRRTLEALLAGRAAFDAAKLRLSLYRALYRSWRADSGGGGEGTLANDGIVASRVSHIDGLSRHALVLSALEGLRPPQVAEVLGLEVDEVQRLLASGRGELRRQPPTDVLIIEDEPIIALDIAAAVERNGHRVTGTAATRADALALARADPPGLVLADIQLADDSSGIDAVREILEEHDAPVIFITAFPERLLTGERPEPAFLLTKPFDPETLNVSIAQALATRRAPA
ncbi:MAG: response regulator [Geminicoccaceae bacterium]|nr:response regulator [Geminicoccaceae bacterium]